MEEDLEIRVRSGQWGVYAAREFEPGDRVMRVEGDVSASPSRYSIQISSDRHIHPKGPDTPWMYLNHSCRPNLAFDGEAMDFVAIDVIEPGEQLTFNYLTTEWDMAEAFTCECGDEECFGIIAGYRHLDEEARSRLAAEVMPHVRRRAAADSGGLFTTARSVVK